MSTVVQSSYSNRMRPPAPGSIHGSDYETFTGNVETAGGIPFGRAVSNGTIATHGDKSVVIGGSVAGFVGITVRDIAVLQRVANTPDSISERENCSILRRGMAWVEPREAVARGDAVYFIAATGVLSNSASGAVGPIKGARWQCSSVAGDAGFRAQVYLPGLQKIDGV